MERLGRIVFLDGKAPKQYSIEWKEKVWMPQMFGVLSETEIRVKLRLAPDFPLHQVTEAQRDLVMRNTTVPEEVVFARVDIAKAKYREQLNEKVLG